MQQIILQIIRLLEKLAPKTPVALFAEKIEKIRQAIKISATSSFRTMKHNSAVGGVYNSRHMENLAVDIVLDSVVDLEHLKFLCKQLDIYFLDEKTHYHLHEPRKK